MKNQLTGREMTEIAMPFKQSLKRWKDLGYSGKLTAMTLWIKGTISHHLAARLSRENVANLLHGQGWGPDENNIWRPDNKLPHVKRYKTVGPQQQLTIVRLRER